MTIKILAAGQSNMIGKPSVNPPDFSTVSPSVRVWNNVNPLGAIGTAFVSAAEARAGGTFEHTDRNSLSPWFADKLARTQFESVDLTVVARGGSKIEFWSPAEPLYPMLAHTQAVWAATGQGPADIFLWHQGESNLPSPPANYQGKFEAMLSDLTAAGVISASTLILIGGIMEASKDCAAFNRRVLLPLAKAPGRGYAHSTRLKAFDVPTYTHFDSASLTALGAKRYYSAYLFARR